MHFILGHFRCGRGGGPSYALVALLTVMVSAAGCASDTQPAPDSSLRSTRPKVVVVNYPLAYFARRIGGDSVDVRFPVPKDVAPAYWEPDDDAIADIQSADLILLNGADYAKWTLRATLPWSRTVVTTRDVEDQYIEIPDAVTHTHGPEGEHSHAAIASETWLDPMLAIAQARVIKEELEKLVPSAAVTMGAEFEALAAELQMLDKELTSAFASSSSPWTASHMAFSYLRRRFVFDAPIVHWDAQEFPTDEQWSKFEELRKGQASSLMLWHEEPTEKTSDRLRSMGVRIVVFHLVESQPDAGDYMTAMRDNLTRLTTAVSTPISPSRKVEHPSNPTDPN